MGNAAYDGLADAYRAFQAEHPAYYKLAADALRRLLGRGDGRCLDVGCGGGHFFGVGSELGWTLVGVDTSEDQLRVARHRHPQIEVVRADAAALPFGDASFDAAFSMFTHTDIEDFGATVRETLRVLEPGAPFVYVGNHPCFVGATQEHVENGLPLLHPGYRRAGRRNAADSPGTVADGWRARLGSFVHLPLGPFLEAFSGFVLEHAEELDDGWEYPKTVALALRKPYATRR